MIFATKHIGQLDKFDVYLGVNRFQDDCALAFDAMRPLDAAFGLTAGGDGCAPLMDPPDSACDGEAEPLGRRAPRHPAIHRDDIARPKIVGEDSCRACWPPRPANMVEHLFAASGNLEASVRSHDEISPPHGSVTSLKQD